jgi:cytochrome c553
VNPASRNWLALLIAGGLFLSACGEPGEAGKTVKAASGAPQDASAASNLFGRGHQLSLSCSGCHGKADAAVPTLRAYQREELQARLQAYKSDLDGTSVMHRLMRGYSDDEIAAISIYLVADTGDE